VNFVNRSRLLPFIDEHCIYLSDGGISSAAAEKLEEKIKKLEAENEATLKQAAGVSKAYDLLMVEMSELQKEKGVQGDKKAD